jgi:Tat protein translocase TatC
MATLDEPRADPKAATAGEQLPRMSFGDHLDELRRRMLRALLAVLVCVLGMVPFHDEVLAIVVEPYRILWRANFQEYADQLEARAAAGTIVEEMERDYAAFVGREKQRILDGTFPFPQAIAEKTGFRIPYELVAVGGLEDFWTFMMAAFLFALAIASPVVIWQAWAFVAAGLYQKERTAFYRYFPFALGLLASGLAFGYFLAVPYGLTFLIRLMKTGQVQPLLAVGQYFTILFALTTAMGLVFQLPLVMVALQRVGLVRHRTYRKHWRWIVLGIFIGAALFTPPDPFTMMLMAIPTLVLYVLGLVLTHFGRRHEAPEP